MNEIRLAPKSYHAAAATEDSKFRTHTVVQSSHPHSDYRFTVINHNNQRPHTMSVSPYSSTNSLNSIDSSGPNSSLRSNVMPSIPCRKKRIAPRPPSQNSIPEDKEQHVEKNKGAFADDGGVFKRSQMLRQNFHVSSPNIMQTNLSRCTKNESSADISLTDSGHTTNTATVDDSSMNRPLSLQLHEDEIANGNVYGSQTHSRTSSDTSDNITRDGNWPEPMPRKRIFIGKNELSLNNDLHTFFLIAFFLQAKRRQLPRHRHVLVR